MRALVIYIQYTLYPIEKKLMWCLYSCSAIMWWWKGALAIFSLCLFCRAAFLSLLCAPKVPCGPIMCLGNVRGEEKSIRKVCASAEPAHTRSKSAFRESFCVNATKARAYSHLYKNKLRLFSPASGRLLSRKRWNQNVPAFYISLLCVAAAKCKSFLAARQ